VFDAFPAAYNAHFDNQFRHPNGAAQAPRPAGNSTRSGGMANAKVEGRDLSWRGLFPWTELFRGFQISLDLNKLLLAAAGIIVMAFGWWLLSVIFGSFYSTKPDFPGNYVTAAGGDNAKGWEQFRREREQWNIMHEAAKVGGDNQTYDFLDLANSYDEYVLLKDALTPGMDKAARDKAIDALVKAEKLTPARAQFLKDHLGTDKPGGTLSTWPWSEDRGPNPYLLVTGQSGIPWQPGNFWDWFLRHQLLVVLEPLVKLVRPMVYFLSSRYEGFTPRLYFFLVFLWTVLTWSFFGGAITRIAAVQVARGEKIGLMDAVNFTVKRLVSYLTAPLFPIGFILVLAVFGILFGVVQLIPLVGDFASGLLWVIPLILGLLIAVTLVGLVVGWPLMSPTISAEGTDSWEAVSRSLSYVFQKPFHYLWYALVACVYGAILIFFVGFMGSFMVYMGKWAVALTPATVAPSRDPTYLMVYAPESFEWRPLLLQSAKVDGNPVVKPSSADPTRLEIDKDRFAAYKERDWHWWNTVGAGLMALWLGLIFLLVIGFGYSFFWSAITIIYMLLRKAADGAELDEVYLEEDETEGVFGSSLPPAPPATAPTTATTTKPLTMVEPPALRPPPEPTATTTTPIPSVPPMSSPSEPPNEPSPAASTPPGTSADGGGDKAPPP
jgi:hypothetical protein